MKDLRLVARHFRLLIVSVLTIISLVLVNLSSQTAFAGTAFCGQFRAYGTEIYFVSYYDMFGNKPDQGYVVYLWQASPVDYDFNPADVPFDNNFYAVGNIHPDDIINISLRRTALGTVTKAIVGTHPIWKADWCVPPAPTPTKVPTPTPVPVAKLKITNVQFDPAPVAWQRGKVHITVVNVGNRKLPVSWSYAGRLVLAKNVQYDFSEAKSPPVPAGLDAQTWTITVRDVTFWDAGNSLSVETTIKPTDASVGPASDLRTVAVSVNRDPIGGCIAVVSKGLCPALGATNRLNGALCTLATVDFDVIDSCKDRACAITKYLKGLGKLIEDVKVIIALYDVFQQPSARQVGECFALADWIKAVMKQLITQGLRLTGIVVHSPVAVLATNESGQRTGFLEDGTILEEIPDSRAFLLEDDKYIVLPPDSKVKVIYEGVGSGVFTLDMIIAEENYQGRQITFENVPVTDRTSGYVDSSGSVPMLKQDSEGMGKIDRLILPSKITKFTSAGEEEVPVPVPTPTPTPTPTALPIATSTPSPTLTSVPATSTPSPTPTAALGTLGDQISRLPTTVIVLLLVISLVLGVVIGLTLGKGRRRFR